jgi:hypothetical protein
MDDGKGNSSVQGEMEGREKLLYMSGRGAYDYTSVCPISNDDRRDVNNNINNDDMHSEGGSGCDDEDDDDNDETKLKCEECERDSRWKEDEDDDKIESNNKHDVGLLRNKRKRIPGKFCSPVKSNRVRIFDSTLNRYVTNNFNKNLSKRAKYSHPLSTSSPSGLFPEVHPSPSSLSPSAFSSSSSSSSPFTSSSSLSSYSSFSSSSSSSPTSSSSSSFFSSLHSHLAPFFKRSNGKREKKEKIIPTIPAEVIKEIKKDIADGVKNYGREQEWFEKEVLSNISNFVVDDEESDSDIETESDNENEDFLPDEEGEDDEVECYGQDSEDEEDNEDADEI